MAEKGLSSRELTRGEVLSKHLGPRLVSIVEKVPVRYVPSSYARHLLVSKVSKYASIYSAYSRHGKTLGEELSESGKSFPNVELIESLALIAARDCYWLGKGANAVLKAKKVPRRERPEQIVASTGLLLHSYGPEKPFLRLRRSVKSDNNWGRRRIKSEKLKIGDDGRVRFTEQSRVFLRQLQQDSPLSGCPANSSRIREPGQSSPVVLYWQAYTKKVFTPWGKKR